VHSSQLQRLAATSGLFFSGQKVQVALSMGQGSCGDDGHGSMGTLVGEVVMA
jgi:hypothetical protein